MLSYVKFLRLLSLKQIFNSTFSAEEERNLYWWICKYFFCYHFILFPLFSVFSLFDELKSNQAVFTIIFALFIWKKPKIGATISHQKVVLPSPPHSLCGPKLKGILLFNMLSWFNKENRWIAVASVLLPLINVIFCLPSFLFKADGHRQD